MIVMIDYDAGNTRSVMNALDRLGAEYILTDDKETIQKAERVIFPGVGHAGAAMEALRSKNLVTTIKSLTQPVLGICVGMQLLAERSNEGETTCLGIVPGVVTKFDKRKKYKVPHMGWNQLSDLRPVPILDGIDKGSYVYFVHSYYLPDSEYSIATCDYEKPFAAAINKDNFWGVQFHPEKSGEVGAQMIKNFLEKEL